MLVLLPPSEGKTAPRRGAPLDVASLSLPVLHPARRQALDALRGLCAHGQEDAARVLGLGPTQADQVRRNAQLDRAPTARADRVYTGVLYEALDLPGLDTAARRRAARQVLVVSALFGLLRPTDRIPAYRLGGTVSLPGLGPVARHWSRHLGAAMAEAGGDGLVVDLRSSTYQPFWRPTHDEAARVATVRVLLEAGGVRTPASHLNKATKGRLVRDLLGHGVSARRAPALVTALRDLGWRAEADEPVSGRPTRVDVVVASL